MNNNKAYGFKQNNNEEATSARASNRYASNFNTRDQRENNSVTDSIAELCGRKKGEEFGIKGYSFNPSLRFNF